MIRVEIGVVGVVGVEIGNPCFLDYGFGWRWRWKWLGLVREGWVFLGLVEVEIGGRGGRFCWRRLGFSGFDRGGDRWLFLYYLVDHDLDWASTKWIRCC